MRHMTAAEFRALHADGALTPAKTRTTRRALPARDGTPMACHCGTPIAGEAAWLRHEAEHGHHRLHCVDDALDPVTGAQVAQDGRKGSKVNRMSSGAVRDAQANGDNDSQ